MSIRILLSDTKRGAERLLENTFESEYNDAKDFVVLVPDRRTLEWEKRLHLAVNKEGSFNIEVCSFRRLALKLLLFDKQTLSPEGAVMLMSKAIKNVNDKLTYFKLPKVSDGFTRDIYSTVTALRSSDISAEALENVALTLPTSLSNKTKDIAIIYREYLSLLKGNYSDGTTKLEALSKLLQNEDFSFSANVFVMGFNSFNARQMDVLQKLFEKTGNLTVALPSLLPASEINKKYYDTSALFKLKKYARDTGALLETKSENENLCKTGGLIFDYLYSFETKFVSEKGYFDLIGASNPQEEVKTLAVCIRKLILNGARYKNIGVTLSDPEKYKPYIDKFFPLYDIPYHIDAPEKLSGHSLIRFIEDILTSAKNNYRREDVLTLLKSPFVKGEYKEKCLFENHVLKRNINFKDFLKPIDDEILEKVRKNLESLLKKASAVLEASNVSEAVDALYSLFEQTDSESVCTELFQREKEAGFSREAEISAHILSRVKDLLEDMKNLLGGDEAGEDFISVFKDNISSESLMLLPVSPDSVLLRTPENSDFKDVDYLFLLGASQGAFPMETGDSAIISVKESALWLDGGVELKPTVKDDLKNQRFEILQLLSGSYKHITALYSKESGDEAVSASFLVKTLAKLFDAEEISAGDIFLASNVKTKEDFLALLGNKLNASFEMVEYSAFTSSRKTPDRARDGLFDALHGYLQKTDGLIRSQKQVADDSLSLTQEDINKLYFGERSTVGVTSLEQYFSCPYHFFLTRGLKLKERETPDLKPNDIGNIIHISLERFFSTKNRTYFANKNIDDEAENNVLKEEVKAIVEKVIEEKDYQRYFVGRKGDIDKEGLIYETFNIVKNLLIYENNTAFKTNPRFSEYDIKSIGLPAYEKNGISVKYVGSIDRVDEWGDYKIVLDYKTGRAKGDFNEVYYGKKIQIYIYMKALLKENGVYAVPAGVFYVPISAKYEKGESDASEQEEGFEKLFLGKYAEDEIKNVFDKRFVKNQKSASVSLQTLHILIDYAYKVAEKAIEEIESGYIEKKPAGGSCEYCSFADVCLVRSDKKYRSVTGADETTFTSRSDERGNDGKK